MTLTVGKPQPLRVAPFDKEIKINECVEVYGNDLEFITKAYFPGEDGRRYVWMQATSSARLPVRSTSIRRWV